MYLVPYGFATTAYGYREFMKETGLENRIRQELDDLDDVENSALLREVCTKIRRMIVKKKCLLHWLKLSANRMKN